MSFANTEKLCPAYNAYSFKTLDIRVFALSLALHIALLYVCIFLQERRTIKNLAPETISVSILSLERKPMSDGVKTKNTKIIKQTEQSNSSKVTEIKKPVLQKTSVEKKAEFQKTAAPVEKIQNEPVKEVKRVSYFPQPKAHQQVQQKLYQQPQPVQQIQKYNQVQHYNGVQHNYSQYATTDMRTQNSTNQLNSANPHYGIPLPYNDAGIDNSAAPQIIENPRLRSKIPPEYPKEALRRGYEGKVIVEALVNLAGYPVEAKIFKSSGFRLLDISAINAVRKWEFDVSSYNRNSVLVRVPVEFLIQ